MFEKKLFLIDFWNGGPLSAGCISAGRAGGYFYVDWNGNISPCVFFPYSIDNIYEMYESNRSLSSILSAPLFESIRSWQHDYKRNGQKNHTHNLFTPCPIRDHYDFAYNVIRRFKAKPVDEEAERAIQDGVYYAEMVEYGRRTANLLDPIWKQEIFSDSPTFKA